MKEAETSKTENRRTRVNLPGLLLVSWLIRKIGKNSDRDRPQIVGTNRASTEVLERAKGFAADGREDADAVVDLRALANQRRRTLRQAERASRFLGYHREDRRANLTNRILYAALTGQPLAKGTALDCERIAIVEAFSQLPQHQQWIRLTDLQPKLVELKDDFRNGQLGKVSTIGHFDDSMQGAYGDKKTLSKAELERSRQGARTHLLLMRKLKVLVGPDCGQQDLLLSSQHALDAARAYILFSSSKGISEGFSNGS